MKILLAFNIFIELFISLRMNSIFEDLGIHCSSRQHCLSAWSSEGCCIDKFQLPYQGCLMRINVFLVFPDPVTETIIFIVGLERSCNLWRISDQQYPTSSLRLRVIQGSKDWWCCCSCSCLALKLYYLTSPVAVSRTQQYHSVFFMRTGWTRSATQSCSKSRWKRRTINTRKQV